jgi:plasmid stabilization system protein ParE
MMARTTLDDRTIAERDLDDLIDYTLDQLDKEAKRLRDQLAAREEYWSRLKDELDKAVRQADELRADNKLLMERWKRGA